MKRPVERVLDRTLRELEREDADGVWLSSSLARSSGYLSNSYFGLHFRAYPSWEHKETSASIPKRSLLATFISLARNLFNNVRRSIQQVWYRIIFGFPKRQPEIARIFEYRKGSGQDTWHFCSNCSNWPTTNYRSIIKKTKTDELCNECQAKLVRGKCN